MGRGHPKIPTYLAPILVYSFLFFPSNHKDRLKIFANYILKHTRMRNTLILLLSLLLFNSCKRSQANDPTKTAVTQDKLINFQILDGDEAKIKIITDSKEDYFSDVRGLEMSIQMGEKWDPQGEREQVFIKYLDYLQEDVGSFTDTERKLMQAMEDTINVLLKNVKKKWIYPEIYLVKLNAKCYGNGVFYTRDNGIYIPFDQLVDAEVGDLTQVFLHEIFHIMSRFNEDFRREAYSLIGFEPIDGKLNFPKSLDDRVFLNPDGVDMNYAITLTTDKEGDKPVKAIPVIHSNSPNYLENRPSFFGYIQFDLFRISPGDGGYKVNIGDDKGQIVTPDIGDYYYPSFFHQIYDNTQYIIHPDEIMADNFMFAIFAKNKVEEYDFSDRGNQLLESFQNLIFN